MSDALDHILTKARGEGLIKGLAQHLIPGGGQFTHVRYADNTVILVRESIKNLKFLLYCFEWMSDL